MSPSVSPKTHCLDQPWRVYDNLLETILATPDLSGRDGLVMMAVEIGELCADSETPFETWFPTTDHLSQPETLAFLRGATIVAQILPVDAFVRDSPLPVMAPMPLPPAPSVEQWEQQTDAIACQAGMVLNLQRLTSQVSVFQEVWAEFQQMSFQSLPPRLSVHELGRLEQFPPLVMYQFDVNQSSAWSGWVSPQTSPVYRPEVTPTVRPSTPATPSSPSVDLLSRALGTPSPYLLTAR